MVDKFPSGNQDESRTNDSGDPEVPIVAHPHEASTKKQEPGKYARRTAHYISIAYQFVLASLGWLFKGVKIAFQSANFWIAIATVVIAVSTSIYAYYAGKQWKAMDRQLDQMIKQMPELQKSAKAAEDSAQIAKDALRPYLSIEAIKVVVFKPSKPIFFWIIWKNDGNSPTIINKSVRWTAISATIPTEKSCVPGNEQLTQHLVVTPHNTRPQSIEIPVGRFRPDQIADVINGRQYFWFCGNVVYTSLEKQESFPLCSYTADLKLFQECKADQGEERAATPN